MPAAWEANGSCMNLGAGGAILPRPAAAALPDGRRRLASAAAAPAVAAAGCLLPLVTSPPASPLQYMPASVQYDASMSHGGTGWSYPKRMPQLHAPQVCIRQATIADTSRGLVVLTECGVHCQQSPANKRSPWSELRSTLAFRHVACECHHSVTTTIYKQGHTYSAAGCLMALTHPGKRQQVPSYPCLLSTKAAYLCMP